MSTVVPTGGNVTPALLLGWASAVCLDDEPGDVAPPFADDLADDLADDAEDVAGPELDDEAVLWVAVLAAAPVPEAELELGDPPHAVSSSTSEPSAAAATAHPRLRITSLSLPASCLTCRR
jgi:hypothetical protein